MKTISNERIKRHDIVTGLWNLVAILLPIATMFAFFNTALVWQPFMLALGIGSVLQMMVVTGILCFIFVPSMAIFILSTSHRRTRLKLKMNERDDKRKARRNLDRITKDMTREELIDLLHRVVNLNISRL